MGLTHTKARKTKSFSLGMILLSNKIQRFKIRNDQYGVDMITLYGMNFLKTSLNKLLSTMKHSFLDYYKMVLERVSFDKELFNKEYKKAVKTMRAEQIDEFNRWIHSRGFR